MPRYVVDGLRIETDVAIEGLAAAADGPIDWRVETRHGLPSDDGVEWTGTVSHQGVPWVRFGRRGTTVCVLVEGWGAVVASRADRRATVHVGTGRDADARALRRAMPYLVALSGGLALHAACVVTSGGAVLLAGASGAGKSTLALAFDALGYPALADDHVALRAAEAGGVEAYPSFPTIEAAADARAFFRPDGDGGDATGQGKVPVLSRTPRPPGPVRVRGLCFLRRGDRLVHEPMPARDAVPLLFLESSFLADPRDRAEHAGRLEAATRLAASVPATLVTVPDGLDRLASSLDDLVAPYARAGRA